MHRTLLASLTACVLATLPVTANAASFDIRLNFLGGLSAAQENVFSRAEAFWESRIVGYQNGINLSGLTITAAGVPVDGAGGFVGLASPLGTAVQGGFTLPTFSTMQFDNADLSALESNGTLFHFVVREMAHAIGFGTMWSFNSLSINGSGLYTGARALAAYQAEFDPDATFIPVELGGGFGIANILWDEAWAGGPNELMTDVLDTPTFISDTTIASFADIGYLIAIPIPTTMVLALTVICIFVLIARRKKFRP